MVQTLIFAAGQTREGMKWKITDAKTNGPADLTDATIALIIYDAVDRTTVIVNKSTPDVETLLPATLGEAQYFFADAAESGRVGRYEVELNPIDFADSSIGILTDMNIVLKQVGPGS